MILGATLEIQRLQREEILEQQIMRQQVGPYIFFLTNIYKYWFKSIYLDRPIIFVYILVRLIKFYYFWSKGGNGNLFTF